MSIGEGGLGNRPNVLRGWLGTIRLLGGAALLLPEPNEYGMYTASGGMKELYPFDLLLATTGTPTEEITPLLEAEGRIAKLVVLTHAGAAATSEAARDQQTSNMLDVVDWLKRGLPQFLLEHDLRHAGPDADRAALERAARDNAKPFPQYFYDTFAKPGDPKPEYVV